MISGEQVNFTYDALNRLGTAHTSSNPSVTQWGQTFTYDGFGNLTNVSVVGTGSAPEYSAIPNNGNQIACADANGNMYAMGNCSGPGVWYDVENRVISPECARRIRQSASCTTRSCQRSACAYLRAQLEEPCG